MNVNSPILGISSDLTKKDRMSAALRWSCPESQPVQKTSLNCGKLHLTNDAVHFPGAALPVRQPNPEQRKCLHLPAHQACRLEADPLAVRRPGTDMNGIVAGVSVFCGRRRGFDGDQFG